MEESDFIVFFESTRLFVLFARHGGQTQPAVSRCHPGQGEENPNCKGVVGNGRVLKGKLPVKVELKSGTGPAYLKASERTKTQDISVSTGEKS